MTNRIKKRLVIHPGMIELTISIASSSSLITYIITKGSYSYILIGSALLLTLWAVRMIRDTNEVAKQVRLT